MLNIFVHLDESGNRDSLPTFCAASLSRIPMLPDEVSDLAAIRKDRVHIKKTMHSIKDNMSDRDANAYASWPPLGKTKPREFNIVEVSTNLSVESKTHGPSQLDNVENHLPQHLVTDVKEKHKTAADVVRQQPAITISPGDQVNPVTDDDFTLVRRKPKRPKKLINGCRTDTTSFAGVKKKSVVCVSRLEQDTSTDAVTDFLSSNGINVCSCYLVGSLNEDPDDSGESKSKKIRNYVSMRICVLTEDLNKIFSPELWPEGVTVRPWLFKTKPSSS